MSYEEYRIKFIMYLGIREEPLSDLLNTALVENPYTPDKPFYGTVPASLRVAEGLTYAMYTIPLGSWTMRLWFTERPEPFSRWVRIIARSTDNIFPDKNVFAGEVGHEFSTFSFGLLRNAPHFALQYVYEIPLEEDDFLDRPPRTPDEIVQTPTLKSSVDLVSENLSIGFSNTGEWFNGVIHAFVNLPQNILNTMIGGLSAIVTGVMGYFAQQTTDTLKDVVSGTPEWFKGFRDQEGLIAQLYLNPLVDATRVEKWIPEEKTLEAYAEAVLKMSADFGARTIDSGMYAVALEAIGLGQLEGFVHMADNALSQFGIMDISKTINMLPIERALLIPFEYAVNTTYPTAIPPYADLINMRVKEKITEEVFESTLSMQGFSGYWSGLIWQAHFIAPSYGEAVKAHYRGGLTYDELMKMLERVDLDPEFNEKVWEKNLYEIPPYTDLVNMRVKEVIGETQFKDYLFNWGYQEEWSSRIWDAHFQPPNLNDILTAWRRRIAVTVPMVDPETGDDASYSVERLGMEDIRRLMELVDLDPRYNSIFETRLYRDPTIRQARYMYEQGALEIDNVQEIVRRDGFEDKYIDPMTQYLTTFQERPFRTTYVSNLASAYIKDVITLDELKKRIAESGYQEGVVNWITLTANVKKEVEDATVAVTKKPLVSVAEIRKAFMFDNINASQVRQRLLAMRYDMVDINLIIANMETDKARKAITPRAVALTQAQLVKAWKMMVIDREYIEAHLAEKGLDADEIRILLMTMDKELYETGVKI